MDKNQRLVFLLLIIAVAFLLGNVIAKAQGNYPPPVDKYVNDYAKVLGRSEERELRAMLSDLDGRTGTEATVLTIGSVSDYGTEGTTIELFATNLFNTWGIGNRQRNDGLLILVAVNDRKARIELGSGYSEELNEVMQDILDEKMLPYFREDDYDRGLREGVQAVIDAVAGDSSSEVTAWFGLLGAIVVIGLTMWVISTSFRTRSPRKKRRVTGGDWHDYDSSSSGESDSFGGGSSSGGGASSEW
jgi:uncharacterized membrane protein YgcG